MSAEQDQQRIRAAAIRSLSGARGQVRYIASYCTSSNCFRAGLVEKPSIEQIAKLADISRDLAIAASLLAKVEDSLRELYKFKPRSF